MQKERNTTNHPFPLNSKHSQNFHYTLLRTISSKTLFNRLFHTNSMRDERDTGFNSITKYAKRSSIIADTKNKSMDEYKEAIDPVLSLWIQDGKLPMVVAGAVTKDDGLVYLNAFGSNNVHDATDKTTADTVFELYSVTKFITATALLQLLEQGKIISIDDPVEKYVPEIKDIKVLEGFDALTDKPILVEPRTKVTIRHLLTHTSGFSYIFGNEDYVKLQQINKNDHYDMHKCRWKEDFNAPLVFHPGEKWHYGCNIEWVGKIVENVSGVTLEAYMQQNIFRPLGVENKITFIRKAEHLVNSAKLHHRFPQDASLKPIADYAPRYPEFHAGGFGLHGSVKDILAILEIFLHNGKSPRTGAQILTPKTLEMYVFNNLLPKGGLPVKQPDAPLKHLLIPCNAVPRKTMYSWTALFCQLPVALPTGRLAGSYFWGGMTHSTYWLDITKGVAGFAATQVFPFGDKYGTVFGSSFEKALYSVLDQKKLSKAKI